MSEKAHPGNAELRLGSGPKAGLEPGAPRKSRAPGNAAAVWRSRGYLPHCDQPGRLQSITFRLADSLPREKLRQLEEELALAPESLRDVERRKRIEYWLDAGIGGCVLRRPRVAEVMEQALLHFDGDRYRLLAWCIMPNHVHVLIEPETVANLARIVQSWKSYTGRWILAHRAELELGVHEKRSGCGSIGIATCGTRDIWRRRSATSTRTR